VCRLAVLELASALRSLSELVSELQSVSASGSMKALALVDQEDHQDPISALALPPEYWVWQSDLA
jgi:sugar (pentulose or hexulose) kinase